MNTFSLIETVASRATTLVCVATMFLVGGGRPCNLARKALSIIPSPIAMTTLSGIAPSVCYNANVGNSRPRPVPTVDPCFIAQNAMRPCKPKLVGVDPQTVGTWKVQQKGGPWVWEIARNGTYKFHSEAGDGVRTHEGTFVASKGRWSLRATNGFADSGTYQFQGRDTWIATGNWGTAAWHLDAAKASSSKPASPVPTKSQSPGS